MDRGETRGAGDFSFKPCRYPRPAGAELNFQYAELSDSDEKFSTPSAIILAILATSFVYRLRDPFSSSLPRSSSPRRSIGIGAKNAITGVSRRLPPASGHVYNRVAYSRSRAPRGERGFVIPPSPASPSFVSSFSLSTIQAPLPRSSSQLKYH